jgi:hypothetical protein
LLSRDSGTEGGDPVGADPDADVGAGRAAESGAPEDEGVTGAGRREEVVAREDSVAKLLGDGGSEGDVGFGRR